MFMYKQRDICVYRYIHVYIHINPYIVDESLRAQEIGPFRQSYDL